MSTSAGWDGVLTGITNEDNTTCEKPNPDLGMAGTCGSATVGITFLLSYLVISFLIVINMYIAVILENYSQATEDVQEGLTDDDYDMYYEIWQQFDPDGSQYIRYDQLTEFLDVLEPPLQIHKPNKYKIISMDIPICRGDKMYCVDILDALTKDFFARKGNAIEETAELAEVQPRPDEAGYEPVSSTLWRQREEYCARLIQHAWRKHKCHKPNDHDGTGDDSDFSCSGGNCNFRSRQFQGDDPTASKEPIADNGRQTAVLVDSDGFIIKNGHRVVIHSQTPSSTSKQADV
jgi:voltage-gated sodium channel type II alpha